MANLAFIAARSRAENQLDPRARLLAENDRLRREVSLPNRPLDDFSLRP
jgi:hypothetical protein